MDLGIRGRKAIVCAASKGLGKACALSLARAGVDLVINSRTKETLEATAKEIAKATGVNVTAVAADISTIDGQKLVLEACPNPDILVNNNGGPPLRDYQELDREAMLTGVTQNMITPIELIQATIDHMQAQNFGRIVNITSGSVKMPLSGLDLSSGARAGLTAFLAGVARSVARDNVTINFLLPGAFDTDRLAGSIAKRAKAAGISIDEAKAQRGESIPAGRLGSPHEFGEACAFLCSAQAGYITGQNLLIDGGAFNGAF